jgi:hypothetical protein
MPWTSRAPMSHSTVSASAHSSEAPANRPAPATKVRRRPNRSPEDHASHLAALIAYDAFFSLFPLLLAFVSSLGFVLHDDASLRDDAIDTALGRIPVIGRLPVAIRVITGRASPLALPHILLR